MRLVDRLLAPRNLPPGTATPCPTRACGNGRRHPGCGGPVSVARPASISDGGGGLESYCRLVFGQRPKEHYCFSQVLAHQLRHAQLGGPTIPWDAITYWLGS